ncbi:hypothetical protein [Nocardia wallacei]|uniref:Rho termination factor N-terminal domain-containing protein n=1 Tax=Nocardia wallacei TaxID=480035 RepID=A0A7G1KG93_9NOCA|nr:hypothetical protein [Nocardia wallacei]BCK52989.1 hypothetical protein NWFMUON74_07610 [Nocardia wallacei]
MNDLNSLAALQARVYQFLESQDEATLRAIISGTAKLGVVIVGDASPAAAASHQRPPIASRAQPVVSDVQPQRDPALVAQELLGLPLERRRSYLSATTLTVSELREVAKRLGLRRYSKLAKATLVEAMASHGNLTTGVIADQPRPPASSPGRSKASAPSIEPAQPNTSAAQIASRLREIDTEDEGAAYIRAQRLDRATLVAVATELHLTRVDRLSRTELEKRVLKQAIGARRRFAGLRKW